MGNMENMGMDEKNERNERRRMGRMDGSHADGWPCGLAAAMALLHTEQMLKGKEGQKNHPWDECPLDGSIFCVERSGITPRPFFLRVFP